MDTQPFDWSEYQKLAQELVSQSGESYLRTAISRAYYYVYHLARERLIKNHFEKSYTHREVWNSFNGSNDLRCRKLFEIAKRLKEKRESADYKSSYPHIEKDAPAMVAFAAQFAIDLSQLDSDLP